MASAHRDAAPRSRARKHELAVTTLLLPNLNLLFLDEAGRDSEIVILGGNVCCLACPPTAILAARRSYDTRWPANSRRLPNPCTGVFPANPTVHTWARSKGGGVWPICLCLASARVRVHLAVARRSIVGQFQ